MHMYTCMHVCTHAHTHAHAHTHTHGIHTQTLTHKWTHTCMHGCKVTIIYNLQQIRWIIFLIIVFNMQIKLTVLKFSVIAKLIGTFKRSIYQ